MRHRRKLEDNIKADIKGVGREIGVWILSSSDYCPVANSLSTGMDLYVP